MKTHSLSQTSQMPIRPLAGLMLSLLSCALQAQTTDSDDLGTLVVTGASVHDPSTVTAGAMRDADALTAGAALSLVPGVSQSKVGARNEQMVYVRGFDLRQTPVFIDGVPVYVPYDGYVDLGRFNTFDLARVQVEKGYSSMLYGANTLGGAINLVSRRPSRPVELDAGVGLSSGRSARTVDALWGYANVGLRQSDWYAMVNASHLDQDGFELPADFKPTVAEDGGMRNNSQARDRKLSLKLGWTPGEDEYALNITDQHGVKGTPPYAGEVASITPRYWLWPYWDKKSAYVLTRTTFGAQVLKLRAYHDVFQNSLFTYDDATYTTQKKPSSFKSWYDDFTNGLSAQLDVDLGASDKLGLAAHWKNDVHREHNAGEPVRHDEDRTLSFGAEGSHRFSPALQAVVGVGRDERQTEQAQDYNSKTKTVSEFAHGTASANNAQALLQYAPDAAWRWHASAARKSRFPTIKDRYSYRLGTALPNADLNPERANHYEIGVDAAPAPGLGWRLAVFQSDIADLIQSVKVSTMCGTSACTQMQNVGRGRARGLELGASLSAGAWLLDGHYQYLDRRNLSQPAVLLTDTPKHQGVVHLAWAASPAWTLQGDVLAAGQRYSASDGSQVAHGFAVLDLKAQWHASPQWDIEAGVHNAADRRYAYAEGFPEPGRTLFLQARFNWAVQP